ncbi:MAG: glutamine--fructose-6-phosphate transaminase (isomerizing) [Gammaproteobacteria bacterium]|nr:glutamine--fructose-6-phosphate transaminase (isomerizing) [Gammaproteobacteria bacterium]|tara:strand:- start:797 stop:2620 length:1824 start_codon:yes stop_codon:yes gene_type:complete
MCGIVGGVTDRNIVPILLEGLHRLEYRGYDSAGIAYKEEENVSLVKSLGRVHDLEKKLDRKATSNIGIAHTRWATHGIPSEKNAHPHSSNKNIFVAHNGIIENHEKLKEELKCEGFKIYSQTDSEVIAHLIEFYKQRGMDFDSSVMKAVSRLKGAYALAVMDKNDPETLIGVRQSSPLVVGEGFDENFLASDIMALSPVTNKFKFLDDGQVVFINKDKVNICSKDGRAAKVPTKEVDSSAYTNDLNGYNHFMEKEIFEQPQSVKNALEGRVTHKGTREGIFGAGFEKKLKNIENIQIVACGTSYHAGRIFEYWSHKFLGINCRVDYGSEYQYQEPVKTKKTLLVTISQSGETADTLASLKFAKKTDDPLTLTICNVANSSLCRESEYTLLTNAGPEIGVASTKAFVTQLACLNLLLLTLMEVKGAKPGTIKNIASSLTELPDHLAKTLKMTKTYKAVAKLLFKRNSTLFLGRGLYFPIAREGALKLKEISYIHAEAYPGGELKHGPLALIDKNMPVIALVPDNEHLDKITSNIEEVAARKGKVITIGPLKKTALNKDGGHIKIPKTLDLLNPIICVVPLQLISYYTALLKGTDVDKPRNLAKSVTVE